MSIVKVKDSTLPENVFKCSVCSSAECTESKNCFEYESKHSIDEQLDCGLGYHYKEVDNA